MQIRLFIAVALWGGLAWLAWSHPARAEEQVTPRKVPALFLLPWQDIHILSELKQSSKSALTQYRVDINQTIIKKSQSFKNWLQNPENISQTISSNQKQMFSDIIVDTEFSSPQKPPLSVEPILCSVANYYVVFTRIMNIENDELIFLQHSILNKTEWKENINQQTLSRFLNEQLQSQFQASLNAIQSYKEIEKTDALKIGLSLRAQTHRQDQGSAQCLNLLLTEELLKQGYTVTQPGGGHFYHGLRDYFFPGKKYLRSTRNVQINWKLPEDKLGKSLALPQNYEVNAVYSESVLSAPFQESKNKIWTLKVIGKKIKLDADPDFFSILAQEKNRLQLSEKPSIVKIYGAWIYLDRGRAWGLKMRDRLQVDDNIKGHVVGFYGPQAGLKTAKQEAISEGAIVFIRKGQNLTVLGQQLNFDPTVYPK